MRDGTFALARASAVVTKRRGGGGTGARARMRGRLALGLAPQLGGAQPPAQSFTGQIRLRRLGRDDESGRRSDLTGDGGEQSMDAKADAAAGCSVGSTICPGPTREGRG